MISDDSGNQSENDEINKVQAKRKKFRNSPRSMVESNSFNGESQNGVLNIHEN